MTKEKIHELIEIVAGHTTMPIKGFQVDDYEFSGELRVAFTFQAREPKYASAVAKNEGEK